MNRYRSKGVGTRTKGNVEEEGIDLAPSYRDRQKVPRMVRWTPGVQYGIEKYLDCPNPAEKLEILGQIQNILTADMFEFSKDTHQSVREKSIRSVLKVWMNLLDTVDTVVFHQKSRYYDIMHRIMVRYEFDLANYIQWTSGSKSQVARIDTQSIMYPTLLQYRQCVLDTAHYVINVIRKETMSSLERRFFVQTLVLVYFRIPLLSGPILQVLCPHKDQTKKSDVEISVLAQVDRILVQLKEKGRISDGGKQEHNFFKWNPSFFQWNSLSHGQKDVELVQLLTETQSQLNAQAKDLIHMFLSDFIEFVSDNSHGKVHWSDVPGFPVLIISAFDHLLGIKLSQHNFLIEKCLSQMSRIPELLSPIVQCCIYSTRSVSPAEVSILLGLLEKLFTWTSKDTKVSPLSVPLPNCFCYDLLLDTLDILLSSEHFQIISRTLLFILLNAGRFYGFHRKQLMVKLVLEKHFQKLFFHWSVEVRQFYLHVLVYCANRGGIYRMTSRSSLSRQRSNSTSSVFASDRKISVDKQRSLSSNQLDAPFDRKKPPKVSKSIFAFAKSLFSSESSEITKSESAVETDAFKSQVNPVPILIGSQPHLSSCHYLSFRKLSEREQETDQAFETRVQRYLDMVRDQVLGKNVFFPEPLQVYARKALGEYDTVKRIFFRVQTQLAPVSLMEGEILIPQFLYTVRSGV